MSINPTGFNAIPCFNFVESSYRLFKFWSSVPPAPPKAPDSTWYDSASSEVRYWQLVRRLSVDEKKFIQDKFDSSKYSERMLDIHYKFKQFENGDLSQFDDVDESAYEGLYGVRTGFVSVETFATFLNYRTAVQDYNDIELVPLFEGGKPSPRAVKIIRQGIVAPGCNLLSDEELQEFWDRMKRQPKSAQILILGKNKVPDLSIRDRVYCLGYNFLNFFTDNEKLSRKLENEITFISGKEISKIIDNVFSRIEQNRRHQELVRSIFDLERIGYLNRVSSRLKEMNEELQNQTKLEVIASFEIMQAFVDIRSQGKYRLLPVLGLSTDSNIQDNALFSSRDMAFNFPRVSLPKEADGYKAFGHSFTYHDFAHGFVSLNIPPEYKEGYNLLYMLAKIYRQTVVKKEDKEFDEFIADLLDMQFVLYLTEKPSCEIFWKALPQLKDTNFYRFAAAFIKKHALDFKFAPPETLPEFHKYWV